MTHLNTKTSTIDVISKEEVVGIVPATANFEDLHEVVLDASQQWDSFEFILWTHILTVNIPNHCALVSTESRIVITIE